MATEYSQKWYEEWKKKHRYTDYTELYHRQNAESVFKKINSALEGFEKSANNYINNYNTRMSNRIKSEYVSDSEAWLSEITGQKQEFDSSAAQIKSLLDKYGRYYGEDYVKSVIGYLDGNAKTQSRIIAEASSDNDYWKQFSKEEYEGWYDSQVYGKKYGGKSYSDIEKALSSVSSDREKAWLSANADSFLSSADAQAELDNLEKEWGIKKSGGTNLVVNFSKLKAEKPNYTKDDVRAYVNRYEDEIKRLEALRDSAARREKIEGYKQEYSEKAENFDKFLTENTEKTTTGFGVSYILNGGNTFGDIFGGKIPEPEESSEVLQRDSARKILSEKDKIAKFEAFEKNMSVFADKNKLLKNSKNTRWRYFSEDEKKIYRYLLVNEGEEKANQYLADMETELDRRRTAESNAEISRNIENGGFWTSVGYSALSVPANIIGGVAAFLDNSARQLSGVEVNPYSDWQSFRQVGNASRQGVSKKIDSAVEGTALEGKILGHNTMSFLYNALMSSADSLAGAYTLGNLYTVSMGMGAAANEAETLYEKGASNSQIFTRSLAAGFAEYITEKVSIENLIKPKDATGFLSAAKEILKQAGIEASEEMASDVLNLIADSAVMAGNSDLEQAVKRYRSGYTDGDGVSHKGVSENEAKKLAWRDFFTEMFADGLSGAISGGLGGTVSTAAQLASGKKADFSENERKVLDSLYGERIAGAEKSGKLSAKEKNRIRAELSEEMKKGYIGTDDIERVLGGESYNAYKNSLSRENELKSKEKALTDEIETILDKENPRIRDTERLSEARGELKELRKKLESTAAETSGAKSKLFHEVDRLTAGDGFIRESYHEREKRGQLFEADLSRYDEKQRAIVQKAVDSGFLNNTGRTHEFVDVIAKISADRGISFDFTNNAKLKKSGFSVAGRTVNGYVTKEGITVNMDSPRAWQTTVGHEVTHILEGGGLYTGLREAVIAYAKAKGEYDSRLASLTKLYEGVEGTDIDSELTAELAGEYLFTDPDFIRSLSTEHRNVFQRIYDEIKHLLKLATAGSREARALEKVKKAFEKAYRENGKKTDVGENIQANENIKFSLSMFDDGQRFVDIVTDQEQFNGLSIKQQTDLATKIIKRRFQGKVIGLDNRVFVNGKTADEYTHPAKHIDDSIYEAKMRASTELDNIVDAGFNFRTAEDGNYGHTHQDAVGGFDYFDVIFKIGNEYYQGVINIKNIERGKLLKDITKIKNITEDMTSRYGQIPSYAFLRDVSVGMNVSDTFPSNNSVSQKEPAVNSKDMQKPEKNSLSALERDYLPIQEGDIAPVGKKGTEYSLSGTEESFGIKSLNDYIGVQKAVLSTLTSEGFFIDGSSVVTNTDSGMIVEITRDGIRETLGPGMRFDRLPKKLKKLKLATLRRLPEIISSASVSQDGVINLHNANSKATYTYLTNDVSVDGEEYNVTVTVRKSPQKNKFWIHEVRLIKTEQDLSSSENPFPNKQQEYNEALAPENSISQDDGNVKKNSLFFENEENTLPVGKNAVPANYLRFENGDIAPVRSDRTDGGSITEDIAPLRSDIEAKSKVMTEDTAPVRPDTVQTAEKLPRSASERVDETENIPIQTVKEKLEAKLRNNENELKKVKDRREWIKEDYDRQIKETQEKYDAKKDKNTKIANKLQLRIERLTRLKNDTEALYSKRINEIENRISKIMEDISKDHTVEDRLNARLERIDRHLENDIVGLKKEYRQKKKEAKKLLKDKSAFVKERADALYRELASLRKGVKASEQLGYLLDTGYPWNELKSALLKVKLSPEPTLDMESAPVSLVREAIGEEYENRLYEIDGLSLERDEKINELREQAELDKENARKAERDITRRERYKQITDGMETEAEKRGFNLKAILSKAKSGRFLETLRMNDNTPQRVNEKVFGYEEGQLINDLTVNKLALHETEGIRWLNSYVGKDGSLLSLSEKYHIKPNSKEDAAAQMYAEGFYVDEKDNLISYGDAELAKDFPNVRTQNNIKGLAAEFEIRKIYDETLAAMNESRVRNGYPEIPRLENYYMHFHAMGDFFSKNGIPFNPESIKSKSLPTDMNGRTADLKPGQPYFASSKHRIGKRTSYALLGGLERYLNGAKNQIFHIDDIQTLRAFTEYIADEYGQAEGLDGIDELEPEAQQAKIKQVFNGHLAAYARFLTEEANVIAGKTSMLDRGAEAMLGREALQFINTVNGQVGKNMTLYNIGSGLTNLMAGIQAFARTNKVDAIPAFAQTVSNKIRSLKGGGDGFSDINPALVRRRGAERFAKKTFEKASNIGGAFAGAVDNITSEFVVRCKYNELIRKGMDSETAHIKAGEWGMKLLGDRSLGQMPLLYNSKVLGLVTKFQLEVRNFLDAGFSDIVKEVKYETKDIENTSKRNAKRAAKITSALLQQAVLLHLFGTAFEKMAGYNPCFDIIEVLITLFGFDDDEENEDSALDNLEQALLEIAGDLPYTSAITGGGRIPISAALPVSEFVNGKDSYGNEKNRWDIFAETIPYYVMPGGYGQLKKTVNGLKMFTPDKEVPGSYTESGNLRFPVEPTAGNVIQAALFGQYAGKNARDYFDKGYAPLTPKQTEEYDALDIPIEDYRKYKKGISEAAKTTDKNGYIKYTDGGGAVYWYDKENGTVYDGKYRKSNRSVLDLKKASAAAQKTEYIASLPLSDEQKDILYRNAVPHSLTDEYGYQKYTDEEGDTYWFDKNTDTLYDREYSKADPEEIEGLAPVIPPSLSGYDKYADFEEFDFYIKKPEAYALSRAVTHNFSEYRRYTDEISRIKSDYDGKGNAVSGSRKKKVWAYINGLDLDYGQKLLLFKSEYKTDVSFDYRLIEYLGDREDISYEELMKILSALGLEKHRSLR